jgi:hypothetical protein
MTEQLAATLARDRWLNEQRSRSAELPALLDRLDAALDAPPADLGSWKRAVGAALDATRTAFAAYAEVDEDPQGFIAASERHAPRFIHALEALRREDHGLLAELTALGHDIAGATTPMEAERIRTVTDRIEHHVATTNRLAMEIANEDLGSGD